MSENSQEKPFNGNELGQRAERPSLVISSRKNLISGEGELGSSSTIGNEQWIAWPKTGGRFFFSDNPDGKYKIYSAKLDGSDPQPLTSFETSDDTERFAYVLNIDDAGEQIAIWSNESGIDQTDMSIHVHNIQTGKDIRLPKYQQFTTLPTISPDGSQVAFAGATNQGTRWRIYIQDIDDSSIRQVWPKYPQ